MAGIDYDPIPEPRDNCPASDQEIQGEILEDIYVEEHGNLSWQNLLDLMEKMYSGELSPKPLDKV